MNKLFIDTSTQALIVILSNDEQVIDYIFDEAKNNHSEKLMTAVETILVKNKIDIKEVDAFYVTEGPGSYTGVRIGVTVAKTLAFSLKKPLYKISSLKVIAASYISESNYIVPVIDARRGNAFSALYKVVDGKLVSVFEDMLYHFEDLMKDIHVINEKVWVVGIDSDKFNIIPQFEVHSQLRTEFKPENIFKLEFENVENVHTFVPNYKRLAEAEMNLG